MFRRVVGHYLAEINYTHYSSNYLWALLKGFLPTRSFLTLLFSDHPHSRISFSLHFSRGLWLSFLVLCSETHGNACYASYLQEPLMGFCQLQGVDLGFLFSWRRLRYVLFLFCGQNVVFEARERLCSLVNKHIHYLTYIDLTRSLKEVFDWSVSKKHARKLELSQYTIERSWCKHHASNPCIKPSELIRFSTFFLHFFFLNGHSRIVILKHCKIKHSIWKKKFFED